MNLGVPEIILIVVVALLFFGPSRLPSLGKSIGEAIRGFKKGISDDEGKSSISSKTSEQLHEPRQQNQNNHNNQNINVGNDKEKDSKNS